jgi:hypothetical protein
MGRIPTPDNDVAFGPALALVCGTNLGHALGFDTALTDSVYAASLGLPLMCPVLADVTRALT